eukprot:CAMPEP_0170585798 /NCGR_PEP_ID=MMETSP0224-20130122/9411_1 /TAXON_ID=285029 /ORGANISM="Togula jolla, Strain CCCM 725" /LENGTH=215 /DNA_ID=CAMNT_0010909317 /DNA_START=877 /DNA_END=1521 /DNA_ORIENTATION=+
MPLTVGPTGGLAGRPAKAYGGGSPIRLAPRPGLRAAGRPSSNADPRAPDRVALGLHIYRSTDHHPFHREVSARAAAAGCVSGSAGSSHCDQQLGSSERPCRPSQPSLPDCPVVASSASSTSAPSPSSLDDVHLIQHQASQLCSGMLLGKLHRCSHQMPSVLPLHGNLFDVTILAKVEAQVILLDVLVEVCQEVACCDALFLRLGADEAFLTLSVA